MTTEQKLIAKLEEKIKILEFLRYWGEGFSKNLKDSNSVKIEERKRLNELEYEIASLEKKLEQKLEMETTEKIDLKNIMLFLEKKGYHEKMDIHFNELVSLIKEYAYQLLKTK